MARYDVFAGQHTESLEASERDILILLGAALMSVWDDLPEGDRVDFTSRISTGYPMSMAGLKAHIARFVFDQGIPVKRRPDA